MKLFRMTSSQIFFSSILNPSANEIVFICLTKSILQSDSVDLCKPNTKTINSYQTHLRTLCVCGRMTRYIHIKFSYLLLFIRLIYRYRLQTAFIMKVSTHFQVWYGRVVSLKMRFALASGCQSICAFHNRLGAVRWSELCNYRAHTLNEFALKTFENWQVSSVIVSQWVDVIQAAWNARDTRIKWIEQKVVLNADKRALAMLSDAGKHTKAPRHRLEMPSINLLKIPLNAFKRPTSSWKSPYEICPAEIKPAASDLISIYDRKKTQKRKSAQDRSRSIRIN